MERPSIADVLLVEDSDLDAELMLRALRKGKYLRPITRVHDGVEALDCLLGTGAFAGRVDTLPRLILLDLHMPRMGGLEMLKNLQPHVAARAIPVFVLIASAHEHEWAEAMALGAQGYLVKPVRFSAFAEVLARVGLRHKP